MSILHLSDLHGIDWYYSWIQEEARRTHYDALVVAGDLLNFLVPKDLPAFLVSGNHDKLAGHPILNEAKWMHGLMRGNVFIDGDSAELGGVCFERVGWGNVPTAESRLPKIVVSHSPPSSGPTGRGGHGMDFGDRELSHLAQPHLARPMWPCPPGQALAQHGRDQQLESRMDVRPTFPNHIVVDTDSGTATWHANGRRQTINLP